MTILVFLGSKNDIKQLTDKELMDVIKKPINSICYNDFILELYRRKQLKNVNESLDKIEINSEYDDEYRDNIKKQLTNKVD